MKPFLIYFEGPDGTGKSTQARLLAEQISAKLVSQPSEDNSLAWIRKESKQNRSYTALERQLLIANSHTVDAYTRFLGPESLVFDRSFISSLVYGEFMGLPPSHIHTLQRLLTDVYRANVADKYQILYIFLDGNKRLDEEDDDVFERHSSWDRLANIYRAYLKDLFLKIKDGGLLCRDEHIISIGIDGLSIPEVNAQILSLVGHARSLGFI